MQIVKYKILHMRITDAFDSYEFQKDPSFMDEIKFDRLINEYIKEEWQPLGAPFVILDKKWQQINQAMVKYAEPPKFTESILDFKSRNRKIPDDIKE